MSIERVNINFASVLVALSGVSLALTLFRVVLLSVDGNTDRLCICENVPYVGSNFQTSRL